MKLHEDADTLARMKTQLANSKMRDDIDSQGDRIKKLEEEVISLRKTIVALIKKLGGSNGR